MIFYYDSKLKIIIKSFLFWRGVGGGGGGGVGCSGMGGQGLVYFILQRIQISKKNFF